MMQELNIRHAGRSVMWETTLLPYLLIYRICLFTVFAYLPYLLALALVVRVKRRRYTRARFTWDHAAKLFAFRYKQIRL